MISIPGITVGPDGHALADQPGKSEAQDRPSRAPTRIDLFVDYMCPYCRRFERDNAEEIQWLVNQHVTSLVMHPISILDRLSKGTMYSTRAAAAAYAVAAGAPDRFGAFNTALFSDQPAEGSSGLSEAELEHLADSIGIEKDVAHTFADPAFFQKVADVTAAAIRAGLEGTPTVVLTGHRGSAVWDGTRPIGEALGSMAAR
jgi:protein-disulfide isomerase